MALTVGAVLATSLATVERDIASVSAANTIAPTAAAPRIGLMSGGWVNTTVSAVSTSRGHTCAVQDGTVYCWGSNGKGQLGTGDVQQSLTPVKVSDVAGVFENSGVTSVVVGSDFVNGFTCALKAGSVYCWGHNNYGQLGDGTTTDTSLPTKVTAAAGFNNTNVTTVSAGHRGHVCAIEASAVYCWGTNANTGQLGDGTTTDRSLPTKVTTAAGFNNTNVTAVNAGDLHTCALEDGKVYCWGQEQSGRLGNNANSFTARSAPLLVADGEIAGGNTAVAALSASEGTSCAIKSSELYCWGEGTTGKLGDGSQVNRLVPTKVATSVDASFSNTAVSTAAQGGSHHCAIEAGVVYCWGMGFAGRIGDGAEVNRLVPTKVATSADASFSNAGSVTALSVGGGLSCAVEAGTLYCWGDNGFGELGDGTSVKKLTPTFVGVPPAPPASLSPATLTITGNVGSSINHAGFTPSGFTGNPTYTVTGGQLPPGVSINSATGILFGAPSATSNAVVTITATDGPTTATATVTFNISAGAPAVDLSPFNGIGNSSRAGTVGTPLLPLVIRTTGMTGPVTFTAVSFLSVGATFNGLTGLGSLHSGLSIVATSSTAAEIVGTPTQAGFVFFKIQAVEGATTVVSTTSIIIEIQAGGGGQQQNNQQSSSQVVVPVLESPSTTQSPSTTVPVGPEVVSPPAQGQGPSLVTAQDAQVLAQAPGAGGVLVNGEPVATEVELVETPAALVAPEQRTPEQVVAVQQAGAALVESFNAAAPDGAEPLVSITNTQTGAVVNGVLVDPRDGVTPVPVPVEDVMVVSAAETKVLLAAATDDGAPEEVSGGVLEVTEGGVVSAIAYGLPTGVAGEVVIFSTPTLLGSFTTGADGSFAGQLTLPALEKGAHTLVLTAGGVTTTLGLMVTGNQAVIVEPVAPTPDGGTLPATGRDVNLPVVLVAVVVTLLGLAVVTRRRVW